MKIKFWLIGALLLVVAQSAWAVPRMINVQGRLTEAGAAVSGAVNLAFEIYNVERGGSALWSSRPFSTTTNLEGVFNVVVDGSHTWTGSFPEFLTDTFYLQVIVVAAADHEVVLTPRQRLVSVPFAITARNVRGGTVDAKKVYVSTTEASAIAIEGRSTEGDGVKGRHGVHRIGMAAPTQSIGILGKSDGTAVWGRSTSDNVAVKGENTYTEHGIGFSRLHYYGIGVEGMGNIGVHGVGATAGGSFESSGIGSVALKGISTGTNGIGVYGKGARYGGNFEGDMGQMGVYGVALNGTGVRGGNIFSSIGVQGTGATAGGSFESTAGDGVVARSTGAGKSGLFAESTRGHGIYAKSNSSAHAGVKGASWVGHGVVGETHAATYAGVYGTTEADRASAIRGAVSGANSTAIYGSSSNATGNGVYAENTGGGPALKVGAGSITVARTSGLNHRSSGVVQFEEGWIVIDVPNSLVTANSIIILTQQDRSSRTNDDNWHILSKSAGSLFRIGRAGSLGRAKIGYLIIN